uniref:Uncharacterized protein n=1 Tax=Heterorhabditis bacteriophora TaxID=37862 RepID=A0A1I7WVZ6_HETBA
MKSFKFLNNPNILKPTKKIDRFSLQLFHHHYLQCYQMTHSSSHLISTVCDPMAVPQRFLLPNMPFRREINSGCAVGTSIIITAQAFLDRHMKEKREKREKSERSKKGKRGERSKNTNTFNFWNFTVQLSSVNDIALNIRAPISKNGQVCFRHFNIVSSQIFRDTVANIYLRHPSHSGSMTYFTNYVINLSAAGITVNARINGSFTSELEKSIYLPIQTKFILHIRVTTHVFEVNYIVISVIKIILVRTSVKKLWFYQKNVI